MILAFLIIRKKLPLLTMFLKGVIRLKKGRAKIHQFGYPWVYSNELVSIDKTIPAGSWVALEDSGGTLIGYGQYNPHSLISFRFFDNKFESEEQTKLEFFRRLDSAVHSREISLSDKMKASEVGLNSYRLCFGESDRLPGFIIDLYESDSKQPIAVMQCHSAGADTFILWAQEWLAKNKNIHSGVVRNDIEVRTKESAKKEKHSWGKLPSGVHALEGGVRFYVDVWEGQKTGYFYDLRENRATITQRSLQFENPNVIDFFSYVGGWGLQIAKKNKNAVLYAVDSSKKSLDELKKIAELNKIQNKIITIESDIFEDREKIKIDLLQQNKNKFDVVIMDPPAITSSAKQKNQSIRVHENCFTLAADLLSKKSIIAFAACSFHFTWEDFMMSIQAASDRSRKNLRITHFGSQGTDHPVSSMLPESRYIKCVIAENN